MKRAVTVQLAGQRLSLRSDSDEALVQEIAAHVDARLREIQRQTRAVDTQAMALLAALQIAEELFSVRASLDGERRAHAASRKALAELKRRVREKSESLLHLLEREARV